MLHGAKHCKNILCVAALGVGLLLTVGAPMRAADHESDCRKRVHNAEENLRKAVDKHGEHSKQAEKRRHELDEAKRDCGDVHFEH